MALFGFDRHKSTMGVFRIQPPNLVANEMKSVLLDEEFGNSFKKLSSPCMVKVGTARESKSILEQVVKDVTKRVCAYHNHGTM
jgi:hypothetical protein